METPPVAEMPAPEPPVTEPTYIFSPPPYGFLATVPTTPPAPEPVAEVPFTPTQVLTPLSNTGYCPNGHMVWSGGPPSEGEFPLTCRHCEVLVPRP